MSSSFPPNLTLEIGPEHNTALNYGVLISISGRAKLISKNAQSLCKQLLQRFTITFRNLHSATLKLNCLSMTTPWQNGSRLIAARHYLGIGGWTVGGANAILLGFAITGWPTCNPSPSCVDWAFVRNPPPSRQFSSRSASHACRSASCSMQVFTFETGRLICSVCTRDMLASSQRTQHTSPLRQRYVQQSQRPIATKQMRPWHWSQISPRSHQSMT